METLEVISRRIDVSEDLESVVRTMKALSMANIRHFEQAVGAVNDYYRTVELGLQRVLRDAVRGGRRRPMRARIVGVAAFGSDQGLCGRFNDDVVQHALLALRAAGTELADRHVLAVGVRTQAGLEDAGVRVRNVLQAPASVSSLTDVAENVLLTIDDWRSVHDVDEVLLCYNRASRAAGHRPHTFHLLPVEPERFETLRDQDWPTRCVPLYTLAHETLFAALLRQYFFVSVFRALAESAAAEHGARLSTMQGAARNIDEHLSELRAAYQHQRQEAITAELLDIVNGFEATTVAGRDL